LAEIVAESLLEVLVPLVSLARSLRGVALLPVSACPAVIWF